jgi:hypothetical protein
MTADDAPEVRRRLAERLDAAGIDPERFIQCRDGEKASVDHSRIPHTAVRGEYGIYATASDRLAILDVDDYGEIEDTAGLDALEELPATLEQESAHGGRHHFYAVEPDADGRLIAARLEDEFGSKNLTPSWGEVRVANQYVVGAGSQLDGCDKDGCAACGREDGGYYSLVADREIATISADTLADVLRADPSLSPDDGDDDPESESRDTPAADADEDAILEFALEHDDKLRKLWNGDYSDYVENGSVDRSKAETALAMKLAFWFGKEEATVARMMDRARTKKWTERTDDSYRESVLSAVDAQTETYEPSTQSTYEAPTMDDDEVDEAAIERNLDILESTTSPTEPAGQLRHRDGCYGYLTGENNDRFERVTNFTLETVSRYDTYEGELLNLRVHPANPTEDAYEVQVHPTVFNDHSSFKEQVVRGRTTRYEPRQYGHRVLNDLRETVGSMAAPLREGTEFLGLSETWDEWVTPDGTLTADGWSDDPDTVYYPKGGSQEGTNSALGQKCALDPEDGADYDADEVASVLSLLPNIRQTERGLPILGWFYAAPLKPLIMDWEGEFNLLLAYGDTGSGKTATIKTFWEAFGADPEPFSASDTSFTVEKHMAESCGMPVWFDEYKPADIDGYRLDRLHRRLREVTTGRVVPKGTADLDEIMLHLRAPVAISGEQQFQEVAVRRRAIMTNLAQAATRPGRRPPGRSPSFAVCPTKIRTGHPATRRAMTFATTPAPTISTSLIATRSFSSGAGSRPAKRRRTSSRTSAPWSRTPSDRGCRRSCSVVCCTVASPRSSMSAKPSPTTTSRQPSTTSSGTSAATDGAASTATSSWSC